MPQNISADKNVRNFTLKPLSFQKAVLFLDASGWFGFNFFHILVGSYLEATNMSIFTLSSFVKCPPNSDIGHAWGSFTVLNTKNNFQVFEWE